MSIQPLSAATTRVLTSTQALNNAASVVKELIDNALDASTSTITIEISANTLDKIVVKDDGIGIDVQDRQLLCKKGYTSKISTLDDLAILGGKSLGFRGTALASVAELSQTVTIVTRVNSERAATTLTFGRDGKLLSSASASHNVGTTVRVEGFLANVPVRKQVILKKPEKVLDEVRKVLMGYALARPAIKFVLRVLKAKSEKHNWSFVGCKEEVEQLSVAAVQVVGKSITSLCKLYNAGEDTDGEPDVYKIEGLLLDTKNDISVAGNVGQYVSIDGRPVSQEKGVVKEVMKAYRKYLQNTKWLSGNVITKPFLVLHLRCPARSYDVNVEPAKDVVLFHDPSKILGLATRLFSQCYGELEEKEEVCEKNSTKTFSMNNPASFNLLLAQKRQAPDAGTHLATPQSIHGQHNGSKSGSSTEGSLVESFAASMSSRLPPLKSNDAGVLIQSRRTSLVEPKLHQDMRTIDGNLELLHPAGSEVEDSNDEEEEYNPNDISVNNPFTRAKAFSIRTPNKTTIDTGHSTTIEHDERSFPDSSPKIPQLHRTPENSSRWSLHPTYHPPTPATTPSFSNTKPYQNPGPPPQRRPKRVRHEEEKDSDSGGSAHLETQPRSRNIMLDSWAKASASNHSEHTHIQMIDQKFYRRPTQHAQGVSTNTHSVNKPFRTPLKTVRSMASPQEILYTSHSPTSTIPALSQHNTTLQATADDADLQYILAFEQRKKMVNQQRKMNQATLNPADLARIQRSSTLATDLVSPPSLRSHSSISTVNQSPNNDADAVTLSSSNTLLRSNPHQNRYLAAVRHLEQRPEHLERTNGQISPDDLLNTSNADEALEGHIAGHHLPETDSRGYLISLRTHSHSTDKSSAARRVKSLRLPFETIPVVDMKHKLLAHPAEPFPLPVKLLPMSRELSRHDTYTKNGRIELAIWSPASKEIEHWQKSLEVLVRNGYRTIEDAAVEAHLVEYSLPHFRIALTTALKAHVDAMS